MWYDRNVFSGLFWPKGWVEPIPRCQSHQSLERRQDLFLLNFRRLIEKWTKSVWIGCSAAHLHDSTGFPPQMNTAGLWCATTHLSIFGAFLDLLLDCPLDALGDFHNHDIVVGSFLDDVAWSCIIIDAIRFHIQRFKFVHVDCTCWLSWSRIFTIPDRWSQHNRILDN